MADWVVLKDPFLRMRNLQLGSSCLTLVMGGPVRRLNKLAQERRVACGSETAFTNWLTCSFVTCTWWGGVRAPAHATGICQVKGMLACWSHCPWALVELQMYVITVPPASLHLVSVLYMCLVFSYKCLCMCVSDASVATWWWCRCAVLTTLFCQWLQCLNKHGVCTADMCIVLLSILLELVVRPKAASTSHRSH